MSDTTTELERLRVDLEVLERYGSEGYGWITNKVRDKIARLEAEAADPWRRAKQVLLEWSRLDSQKHGEKWLAINLVTHLTSERDRLAARVAELENEPEPAKVSLRRVDEIKIGDQIVTSGEIRTVDAIYRNDEKSKIQLCSLGWGSWFEPSGIIAVVNDANPNDPILEAREIVRRLAEPGAVEIRVVVEQIAEDAARLWAKMKGEAGDGA